MRKETVVAIGFGIFLGLIVALVLILRMDTTDRQKQKPLALKPSPTMVQIQTKTQQMFEVQSPVDGEVVSVAKTTISLSIPGSSLVIIQSPTQEIVFTAEAGKIEKELPLSLGENIIRVTLYPNDKSLREQDKVLRVYYLEES